MKIIKIPIENIKVAKYNPRLELKPGDVEYEKIKKSVEEFGLVDPLVWNEHNNVLIGGHQRLTVLKELGWKEVDVSVVSIKDENKEKILNIALNKTGGDWDYNKLQDLIYSLSLVIDTEELKTTGFSSSELDNLIDKVRDNLDDKIDDIPEKPKNPVTKPGDLWRIGDHFLMCGDSLNLDQVGKLMQGQKCDLVFTDPPYNVDYEGYTEEKLKIKNDKMSLKDFIDFLNSTFASYRFTIKDGASMYVCMSPFRISA